MDINSATRRTRRIKCDEGKPTCGRCIVANVPCEGLGYAKAADAAIESVAPSPQYNRSSLYRLLPIPSSVPQLHGSAEVRDLLSLVPQMPRYLNNTFTINPVNTSSEYILFGGHQLALYLDFLPSRLGRNTALDQAISSVVSALRDIRSTPDCRTPIKTLSCYTQALNSLQKSLRDAEECLSAEILCAVHLHGIFEVRFTMYDHI